ncbi:hypothetical protein [Hahella sp. NBU794]|uniref:hypothetical protein n=1 Tax=Hahella sp. NBU794 TaxID=3422590 RepID=UPI003D6FB9F3
MFNIEVLDQFYNELSKSNGMSVAEFRQKYSMLLTESRTDRDAKDYRLGKDPWKKLRDEVAPVFRFLKYSQINPSRIRFPLDNNTPDCWLLDVDGEDRGVEVTIERGRERYHLAKELNEAGEGRGFIGVQDDASQEEFDTQMSSPQSTYSTEQALDAMKSGVISCLKKKKNVRYSKVFYLLIQADLSVIPNQRWSTIENDLWQVACDLPFKEIHVIGNADGELYGFQIK